MTECLININSLDVLSQLIINKATLVHKTYSGSADNLPI